MRCSSYCTAAGYEIPRLFQFLKMMGSAQLFLDVIYFRPREEGEEDREIFYFPYGSVVFWGFDEKEEKILLATLKKFEKDPVSRFELDEFDYEYGEKMQIEDDVFILEKKDPLTKLSLSHAISQSVKLTVFEESIAKTVEHTKNIPKDLALKGNIPLSRKEASQKMGEIFLERNYINLQSEILDTPEFFWEHSDLEPIYRKMILNLDVTKRVELLNRKLNLLHELFEILGNELNHQHSSRLEMTIIILIVIEVVILLLKDLFHLI